MIKIDSDINNKIDEYYLSIIKNHKKKGNLKNSIRLICLYNILITDGNPIFKEDLLETFGLEKKQLKKGIKFCKENNIPIKNLTIIDIVKIYLRKLLIKNYNEKLIEQLYEMIISCDIFNRVKDKTIAGLIVYYLLEKNKILEENDFYMKIDIGKVTIEKYIKDIHQILDNL